MQYIHACTSAVGECEPTIIHLHGDSKIREARSQMQMNNLPCRNVLFSVSAVSLNVFISQRLSSSHSLESVDKVFEMVTLEMMSSNVTVISNKKETKRNRETLL